MKNKTIPIKRIHSVILTIRKQKVMLDRDLSELYGVETRRLNEQVKRNISRFPKDFMFQLTKGEKDKVVANCDHLQALKYSRTLPYAFTEHGVIMLASILNTDLAIKTSVLVVRAFVQLRKVMATHEKLVRKIDELEIKCDAKFSTVFKAIKQLIDRPDPPRKRIGFIKDA